jgi:hypothetical protein
MYIICKLSVFLLLLPLLTLSILWIFKPSTLYLVLSSTGLTLFFLLFPPILSFLGISGRKLIQDGKSRASVRTSGLQKAENWTTLYPAATPETLISKAPLRSYCRTPVRKGPAGVFGVRCVHLRPSSSAALPRISISGSMM